MFVCVCVCGGGGGVESLLEASVNCIILCGSNWRCHWERFGRVAKECKFSSARFNSPRMPDNFYSCLAKCTNQNRPNSLSKSTGPLSTKCTAFAFLNKKKADCYTCFFFVFFFLKHDFRRQRIRTHHSATLPLHTEMLIVFEQLLSAFVEWR